jgi:tRNA-specific 2-thiouridylase
LFWISGSPPNLPLQCNAKVRYRQSDQSCVVSATDTGFLVQFDFPQRAITPGQSVVFYDNDTCLGGGIIESAL